jgi:c-di-GMP-specific phosphodiesterase
VSRVVPAPPPAGRGTRLTRFLDAADALLATETSLDEALRGALRLVCQHADSPLGHVFRLGEDRGVLEPAGIWYDESPARHEPFVAATRELQPAAGSGISGRVMSERRAIWVPDLEQEDLLPRQAAALASGLRSALAFPILGERGIEGVIELFGRTPAAVDADLLALAAHVGRLVGRVIDQGSARRQLRETERLAQLGAWTWDVENDVVEASAELFAMHGLEPPAPEERAVVSVDDWLQLFGAGQRAHAHELIARIMAGGAHEEFVYQVRRGRAERWLSARAEVVERRHGRAVRIAGYTQDITARRRAEERRRRAQRELAYQQRVLERIARGAPLSETLTDLCRHIERQMPGAMCSVLLLDRSAGVLRHGAAPSLPAGFRAAIDGLPVGEGMGACGTAAARADTVVVGDAFTDPLTHEFVELAGRYDLGSVWSRPLIKPSGEVLGTFALYRHGPHRPTRAELRLVSSCGHLAALAIERSQAEAALQAAADLDSLTGLPNRARFLELVNRELGAGEGPVSVMMVRVDRLDQIADGLGRLAADRILAEAAERLGQVCGERGLLARFSGDTFTLMVPGADRRAATRVADHALEAIERPIGLEGGEFFLTASVGIAVGDGESDAYLIVRHADAALQEARVQGHGTRQVFDRRVRGRRIARFNHELELRRAIERRELIMHYQPIVDLETRNWSGVEALVRWQHPQRGLIGPDDFIPLAEETGLIVPLGSYVLDQVVAQAAHWAEALPGIVISANASILQLADPNLAEGLLELLHSWGLPPSAVRLEVTETALMQELDTTRQALEQLMRAGVRILIDDFGTGYSSIARLGELPIAGLKIDRRFTRGLGDGDGDEERPVLRAIADLARAYDLKMVAEGIETARALAHVDALGCQYAQGYHLGRPGPPERVEAILRRRPPLRFERPASSRPGLDSAA